MKLTDHFSLEELVESGTALRLGIDNRPGPEIVSHLQAAAEGLELVRALLGGAPINVSSGYRCEALERIITKNDFTAWCARRNLIASPSTWPQYFAGKAHPKGYASDFTCRSYGAPAAIVREIARSGIQFDQLIEEGTWVHVSFDPQMRGEVLTARFAGGVPSYSKAY